MPVSSQRDSYLLVLIRDRDRDVQQYKQTIKPRIVLLVREYTQYPKPKNCLSSWGETTKQAGARFHVLRCETQKQLQKRKPYPMAHPWTLLNICKMQEEKDYSLLLKRNWSDTRPSGSTQHCPIRSNTASLHTTRRSRRNRTRNSKIELHRSILSVCNT